MVRTSVAGCFAKKILLNFNPKGFSTATLVRILALLDNRWTITYTLIEIKEEYPKFP